MAVGRDGSTTEADSSRISPATEVNLMSSKDTALMSPALESSAMPVGALIPSDLVADSNLKQINRCHYILNPNVFQLKY